MWLSIFGVCAAFGFIGGLMSRDWLLGSLGLVMGIISLVRIIMIRRILRVRLAAKLSELIDLPLTHHRYKSPPQGGMNQRFPSASTGCFSTQSANSRHSN
jgi:hypothetical protein